MRYEERCKCGGELVLVYDSGRQAYTSHEADATEAHKAMENFRKRHRPCLAPPAPVLVSDES